MKEAMASYEMDKLISNLSKEVWYNVIKFLLPIFGKRMNPSKLNSTTMEVD